MTLLFFHHGNLAVKWPGIVILLGISSIPLDYYGSPTFSLLFHLSPCQSIAQVYITYQLLALSGSSVYNVPSSLWQRKQCTVLWEPITFAFYQLHVDPSGSAKSNVITMFKVSWRTYFWRIMPNVYFAVIFFKKIFLNVLVMLHILNAFCAAGTMVCGHEYHTEILRSPE